MPRRSQLERVRGRTEALRLWIRGWSEPRIALKLGVDTAVICRDLAQVKADYLKRVEGREAGKQARMIAEELAKIGGLEMEYWEAWDRSREVRESTATEKIVPEEGKGGGRSRTKASVKREEMLGISDYLEGVRWCVDRRLRVLGLDAPQRHEVSGPNGGPLVFDYLTRAREVVNGDHDQG